MSVTCKKCTLIIITIIIARLHAMPQQPKSSSSKDSSYTMNHTPLIYSYYFLMNKILAISVNPYIALLICSANFEI